MRELSDNAILDTEEVGRLFNVGSAAVRQWVKLGKIPARKLGRSYVFIGKDIKRALSARLDQEGG